MTSTTDTGGRSGPAEFEKTLTGAETAVAQFEEGGTSPVKRLQHFLHNYPTTIPFIVLFLGVLAFSLVVGERFYAVRNLSIILDKAGAVHDAHSALPDLLDELERPNPTTRHRHGARRL